MSVHRALAPAKVNLGLFVGPRRPQDSRHELVTVMQSISLADELTLAPASEGTLEDEVLCPGVSVPSGENLAARALSAFRVATGWDSAAVQLSIVKRIPVAAGLGGGSADAAATLRLARHASGLGDEQLLRELGASLGADVPAQVSPGRWLATGAGELLEPLPNAELALLVLPVAAELSAAAVYAQADRLELGHSSNGLAERLLELRHALELGAPYPAEGELLDNDLQAAALSLCPPIAATLSAAREASSEHAFVSGSGPTVVGLFAGPDAIGRCERAVAGLAGRLPTPIAARAVDATFGRAVTVAE